MVLKLDARFPLLWRTPQSLQFGVDRPSVVLESVSNAQERVIAALLGGVTGPGAQMIGQNAGLDDLSLHALLGALRPAFASADAPPPGRVVVSGSSETAARVADILRRSGAVVVGDRDDDVPDDRPNDRPAADLAVIVAHYVIDPELHGRWLRRDIPHLPIVYGDRVVQIGPLVRPGTGPCLYCLERHRTDADPARPALAAQLWGRTSSAETALVAGEVAALACRMMLAGWHRPAGDGRRTATTTGAQAGGTASVDLDVASGERFTRQWSPHPDCGCLAVDAGATRLRR